MRPTGDERLRVSARRNMETTIISLNPAFLVNHPKIVNSFLKDNAAVRMNGSTTLALALVASGQSDLFMETRVHLWDIATGYLLVKEAGGIVQTWSGKTTFKDIIKEGSFMATTMDLRDKIVKKLPKTKKNLQKK